MLNTEAFEQLKPIVEMAGEPLSPQNLLDDQSPQAQQEISEVLDSNMRTSGTIGRTLSRDATETISYGGTVIPGQLSVRACLVQEDAGITHEGRPVEWLMQAGLTFSLSRDLPNVRTGTHSAESIYWLHPDDPIEIDNWYDNARDYNIAAAAHQERLETVDPADVAGLTPEALEELGIPPSPQERFPDFDPLATLGGLILRKTHLQTVPPNNSSPNDPHSLRAEMIQDFKNIPPISDGAAMIKPTEVGELEEYELPRTVYWLLRSLTRSS